MHTIDLVLLLIAVICFGLAAAGVPSRVAWVAVPLIAALQGA